MAELVIRFRAPQGAQHLRQDPPACMTHLSAEGVPRAIRITDVRLNGRSLKFMALAPLRVWVSPPIPDCPADFVEIRCSAEEEPSEAPRTVPATCPLPDLSYGLQRPETPAIKPQS